MRAPGKRFRPALQLLVNGALAESSPGLEHPRSVQVLQSKMIEATELIHTASLMHDDVIDNADTRRSTPTPHTLFGNKRAILGGDFLLARACRIVSSFGVPEALQRTAQSLENLAKGELIQAELMKGNLANMFKLYLSKSYLKTAAIMAEGCACGALLGGYSAEQQQWAFRLGTAVGMAFQINDDILDYTFSGTRAGKPTMNDAKEGVITAPLIFAAIEHPAVLKPLLGRPLTSINEQDKVAQHVESSSAIPLSRLTGLLYLRDVVELIGDLERQNGGGPFPTARGIVSLVSSTCQAI